MQMSRKQRKAGPGTGKRRDAQDRRPALPDLDAVASATECTGLVPALPPEDLPEE